MTARCIKFPALLSCLHRPGLSQRGRTLRLASTKATSISSLLPSAPGNNATRTDSMHLTTAEDDALGSFGQAYGWDPLLDQASSSPTEAISIGWTSHSSSIDPTTYAGFQDVQRSNGSNGGLKADTMYPTTSYHHLEGNHMHPDSPELSTFSTPFSHSYTPSPYSPSNGSLLPLAPSPARAAPSMFASPSPPRGNFQYPFLSQKASGYGTTDAEQSYAQSWAGGQGAPHQYLKQAFPGGAVVSPMMLHQPSALTRARTPPRSSTDLRGYHTSAFLSEEHAPIPPSPDRDSGASSESPTRDDNPIKKKTKYTEGKDRKWKTAPFPPIPPPSKGPTKSALKPPKPAPSTWQIFFGDYLQEYKDKNPQEKLNVAHIAKEAGVAYKSLTAEKMEVIKKRARSAKDAYNKDLLAWQRTLTPDDIRNENAFRTAQRKAGKSRKSNIKDPNAPKKPLSAYFMFLAKIRSDPALVQEVFEGETETTRQSVLAALKWRSLSDDERRPFLAQAEADKIAYLAKAKEYEETYVTFAHERSGQAKATITSRSHDSTSEPDSDGVGEDERNIKLS